MKNQADRLVIRWLRLGAAAMIVAAASVFAQPIPGSYIAVFKDKPENPGQSARELEAQHGFSLGHVYEHSIRGFSFAGSPQAADALAHNPRIAYVEQDQWAHAFATINPVLTGIRRVGITQDLLDQRISPLGQPVNARIAIIDTGLDRNHPDLNIDAARSIRFYEQTTKVKGKNVTQIVSDTNWDDRNGHGTHVGGTAAGNGNVQVVGVAPGALLTAVNVLGASGSAPVSVVIAGVDWVAANSDRFDVANMSLGGGFSDAMNRAVKNATEKGVVFAVAAMNDGSEVTGSPASEPSAITVSAIADFDGLPGGLSALTYTSTSGPCVDASGQSIPNYDDTLVCFSNYGAPVDIAAPGTLIYSTWTNGTYKTISGTSMATPHVAGAAALYIALNRNTLSTGADRVTEVTQAIISSGWKFGDYGYFTGDKDSIHEPLLNIQGLLGVAQRPNFHVTISGPADGTHFNIGDPIQFQATAALDSEDWTPNIVWNSSIDGDLPQTGGSVSTATLSEGTHTITASVTDAGTSFSGWDSITVVVGNASPPPPPPARQLFVTVATDKREYVQGQTMHSTFTVTEDSASGARVAAAQVSVVMIDAKGGRWTSNGQTDANGVFTSDWSVSGRGGKGTYNLTGTATKDGYLTGLGSGSFTVK